MSHTTQNYSFDNQEDLDYAISALSAFDPELYKVVSTESKISELDESVRFELNIWFADLATVRAYCEIIFSISE